MRGREENVVIVASHYGSCASAVGDDGDDGDGGGDGDGDGDGGRSRKERESIRNETKRKRARQVVEFCHCCVMRA